MQSSSPDQDPAALLVEVLTRTINYLDRSFDYILEGRGVDFSHIGLYVDSLDFDENAETNSVSFSFSGNAFFNSSPPPSEDDVLKILAQSFLGRNNQVYTDTLMQSTSSFLQRLSYAVVQVNGFIVPGNMASESTSSEMQQEDTANTASSIGIEELALIVGSATAALLLILLCYCFFCVRGESNGEKMDISRAVSASGTHDTEDVEKAISPAPSSPHSIASQDSSVFTYNLTSSSRINLDASVLSSDTSGANARALASWQQKNTINSSKSAPFGHDISAIGMLTDNQRDLSLIEEGEEEATPVKYVEQYLDKEYLSIRGKREAMEMSYQSEDVIADLNNLSQQINRHRRR